jgi:hypothetical protein
MNGMLDLIILIVIASYPLESFVFKDFITFFHLLSISILPLYICERPTKCVLQVSSWISTHMFIVI